jgi:hypothetical protein
MNHGESEAKGFCMDVDRQNQNAGRSCARSFAVTFFELPRAKKEKAPDDAGALNLFQGDARGLHTELGI